VSCSGTPPHLARRRRSPGIEPANLPVARQPLLPPELLRLDSHYTTIRSVDICVRVCVCVCVCVICIFVYLLLSPRLSGRPSIQEERSLLQQQPYYLVCNSQITQTRTDALNYLICIGLELGCCCRRWGVLGVVVAFVVAFVLYWSG